MPRLTRWYIKTAMVWFIIALALGILDAMGPAHPGLSALRPAYLHLFVMGWITQMIFGVAFWMFPRFSRERPRRSEVLGWATYAALNLGLVARVAAEPPHAVEPSPLWAVLLVVSAALQWLAGILFVLNTWGRVKEK